MKRGVSYGRFKDSKISGLEKLNLENRPFEDWNLVDSNSDAKNLFNLNGPIINVKVLVFANIGT